MTLPLPALTPTHEYLLMVLNGHIGAGAGLPAAALVHAVNDQAGRSLISERHLRSLIHDLRLRGHHICATPEHGYHLAANEGELLATCRFLYQRGMTGLQQVAAMRRVSLPDLAGQLRIPLEPTA